MSTTTTTDLAGRVIATLQAHEAELRQAGIRRRSLFGSVARGDAEASSDINLAAELDPEERIGLLRSAHWNGASPRWSAGKSTCCQNQSISHVCGPTSTEIAGVPSRHDPADSLADIVENEERIEQYSVALTVPRSLATA